MSDYLSADEAVNLLVSQQADPEAEAGAPVEAAPAAEAEISSQDTPSEALTGAEDPDAPEGAAEGDPAGEETPETPAVEPPAHWSAEAKARWSELTPELQSVVLEQTKAADAAVGRSQEAAAQERKAAQEARQKAEAEYSGLSDLAKRLGEVVPRAEQAFTSQWDKVTPQDWLALSQSDPDQYTKARALYEAEKAELQRLQGARAEADKASQAQWARQQADYVREYAPELADPVNGRVSGEKVVRLLSDTFKVTPDEMKMVDGRAIALAHQHVKLQAENADLKAQLEQAKKGAVTPTPKPAAQPAPGVRAKGAPAQAPKTAAATAMASLQKSGRPEDAVAALLAMQKG